MFSHPIELHQNLRLSLHCAEIAHQLRSDHTRQCGLIKAYHCQPQYGILTICSM